MRYCRMSRCIALVCSAMALTSVVIAQDARESRAPSDLNPLGSPEDAIDLPVDEPQLPVDAQSRRSSRTRPSTNTSISR